MYDTINGGQGESLHADEFVVGAHEFNARIGGERHIPHWDCVFDAVSLEDVARVLVQQRRHAEAVDDATQSDVQTSLEVELEDLV